MNSLTLSQFSRNIFVTKLDTKPLLNQHSAGWKRQFDTINAKGSHWAGS